VDDPFDFREIRIRQPGRLIPGKAKYEIFDTGRHLLAIASEEAGRSWMQTLARELPGTRALGVRTAAGKPVGRIRISGTRRQYTLVDGSGEVVGEAVGDLAVKNFAVTGAEGTPIASVRKTWAGLKEVLTSADNYTVKFADPVPGPARVLTVMMTIVLDLARYGPD
jgi:hypothetical protein